MITEQLYDTVSSITPSGSRKSDSQIIKQIFTDWNSLKNIYNADGRFSICAEVAAIIWAINGGASVPESILPSEDRNHLLRAREICIDAFNTANTVQPPTKYDKFYKSALNITTPF